VRVETPICLYCAQRRRERRFWEEGSTLKNRQYLHAGLPTKDFLILTDFKCLRGFALWLAKGFDNEDDPLRHAGLVIEASTPGRGDGMGAPMMSPARQ
jgi:hypothetical protein